jgi:hypothetical protein
MIVFDEWAKAQEKGVIQIFIASVPYPVHYITLHW